MTPTDIVAWCGAILMVALTIMSIAFLVLAFIGLWRNFRD